MMATRAFELSLVPGHPVEIQPSLTLRPRYGLPMVLKNVIVGWSSPPSTKVKGMSSRDPHPNALTNHERAYLPEGKVRYPLRDPDKRRAFEALGFAEGDWEDLREAIVEALPFYPARFSHRDRWGITYDVDMPIVGPRGREAPVRTKWIYRIGEDHPRLVTLYVRTTEWRRWEREGRF